MAIIGFCEWVGWIFSPDVPVREVLGIGLAFLMFACISAIVAMVTAWFLHCAIVVIRTKRRERNKNA